MANRTRREFFSRLVDGVHGAALASLVGAEIARANGPGAAFDLKPKAPHFPGKAKAVIHLFMNGGPSQVDLFDPKPTLTRLAGTAVHEEMDHRLRLARKVRRLRLQIERRRARPVRPRDFRDRKSVV